MKKCRGKVSICYETLLVYVERIYFPCSEHGLVFRIHTEELCGSDEWSGLGEPPLTDQPYHWRVQLSLY